MRWTKARIHTLAHHLPEQVLTSQAIEEELSEVYRRLRLPEGRLELMTGIQERRLWPVGTRPSDLSTQAAQKCLQQADFDHKKIDLLIHASVCRDFLEPATASVVHSNLNLSSDCQMFDLSNACLGVMNGIELAAHLIEAGTIKSALIVSGENGGPLLEKTIEQLKTSKDLNRKTIKKYIANLTIGAAACAVLVTHEELAPNGHTLLGGAVKTNSTANELCQGGGNTHELMMETDSEALLAAGVELVKSTWESAKRVLSWNTLSVDWVVGHQVGSAHEKAVLSSIDLDKVNTFNTYPTLGNTGSAALPVTLSIMNERKMLAQGDQIALIGIGSGLTCSALGVAW